MNYKWFCSEKFFTRRISRGLVILACLLIVLPLGASPPAFTAAALQEAPSNSLPEGEHTWAEGQVHSFDCMAAGWVIDLDQPGRILNIQILADSSVITTLPSDFYCADEGWCVFYADLWGLITPVAEHQITAQAYDEETGVWIDLSGTPKTLSCVNYDIYAYDLKTGQVKRITTQEETAEYNPEWSPDGKYIVYNVVPPFTQDLNGLYITEVGTGETARLMGGENGGSPAWSPNGQWIVFDEGVTPEENGLYLVSPEGGTREMVRDNAQSPDWSPNSKMLVYQRVSDESLMTAPVRGGDEHLLVQLGFDPNWSPNGQWIVYSVSGELRKVRVNLDGIPQADPVLLASGFDWISDPGWSNNSQTIIFAASLAGEAELWTIPADGGEPVKLTGLPELGKYDPGVSNNGRFVAYSGPQIP